jgi:hypothetical protein
MIITKPLGELFVPTGLETAKEMTKRYLDLLEEREVLLMPNNTKHKRMHLPSNLSHMKDVDERAAFKKELLRRWKHGHDGMCGMMYSYFHYVKIYKRAGGGAIDAKWRNYDNAEFELLESCLYGKSKLWGNNTGKGIIGLGARGKGKSAKAGHAALSVIQCNKETTVLLTSKDEEAAEKVILGEKIKFEYYRLPEYLKYSSDLGNNRSTLHLGKQGKNRQGQPMILGNDSKVVVKAPMPEALEGFGAKYWFHDEGPKTKNLMTLVDYTLPALCDDDGITRIGVPHITGVAGDFGKFGDDYIELWNKADDRNLIRWFVPGWVGVHLDEYGNEDIEQACETLFEARLKAFHAGETALQNHLQQSPMTPEEALLTSSASLLPKKKIIYQAKVLQNNEPAYKQGSYDWSMQGKTAVFRPDRMGKHKLLEMPEPNDIKRTKYVGFIDAYDIKKVKGTGSKGAAHVFKRKCALTPMRQQELLAKLADTTDFHEALKIRLQFGYLPVAQYIDAPEDPRDFAENAAKMFTHFACPVLVEKFPAAIFMYFKDHYKHLMQYAPVKPKSRYTATDLYGELGMKVDDFWKQTRTGYLQNYYESHYEWIYFEELIADAMTYDPEDEKKKHDSIDSLGGCLIHDDQPILRKMEEPVFVNKKPIFGFKPDGNGGIAMV